jgi:hypothetical protein
MAFMTKIARKNVPTLPIMKKVSWSAIVMLAIGVVFAAYIGVWVFFSNVRNQAFDLVQIGDAEHEVIALFGTEPSMHEKQGILFARYATKPCSSPCVERLWFENRLSLSGEAWSIEVDQSGRVIDKSRWVSP